MNKFDVVCDLGSNFVSVMTVGGFIVKDPSVVAVDLTDNSIKYAGTSALKAYANEMSNLTLSYPIKDGAIVDDNAAAALLTNTLSKLLGNVVFSRITVYAIVPCSLSKGEKSRIESVFNAINVKQVKFLLTPLADAKKIYSEFGVSSGIICDIGAEVTDICAVIDDKIVCGCSAFIGGNDITNAIIEQIAEKYYVRISPQEAENLKLSCASLYANDNSIHTVTGLNTAKGHEEQVNISARELFNTVANIVKDIIQLTDGILQSVAKDVATQLKTEGIFLCGGGAQLTGIDKFLFAGLKLNVRIPNNPQDVTVLGGEMLAKLLIK